MFLSIHALSGFCRMFLCMDHMVYPISIDLTNPFFQIPESSPDKFSHTHFIYDIFLLSLCGQRCRMSSLEFVVECVGCMKDHMMSPTAYDETTLSLLYLIDLKTMTEEHFMVFSPFVMQNLFFVL